MTAISPDPRRRALRAPPSRPRRPRPGPGRRPCRGRRPPGAPGRRPRDRRPRARARARAVALLLAAVHAGRALVDGVPALDLVAEHVDVVVERLGRRERRLVGEADGLVDDTDDGLVDAVGLALLEDALLLQAAREDLDR